MQVSNRKNASSFDDLLPALQTELKKYFDERPKISLNALSKRCAASEPTLRRILKGQVKTLPNASTIVDILVAISGEKKTTELVRKYPGPIAQYLTHLFPHFQDLETEQNQKLRKEISNPTKYLIFKLSANAHGLTKSQLSDMFGELGERAANELLEKGLIEKKGDKYFSKVQNFTASRTDFIPNFKLMADFIKLKPELDMRNHLSVKVNYSESVSLEAYREILQIQNKALQKIRLIMSDTANYGEIPIFYLAAIDTFDTSPLYDE